MLKKENKNINPISSIDVCDCEQKSSEKDAVIKGEADIVKIRNSFLKEFEYYKNMSPADSDYFNLD